MLLACRHCGAPLDVREGRRVVRCTYCGVSSEVFALATIAAETPRDFRPPPTWTPPPHVPADSNVALPHRPASSGGLVVVISVGAFLGMLGAGMAVAFTHVSSLTSSTRSGALGRDGAGATAADLAALTMRESRGEVTKALRTPELGSPSGQLRVKVQGLPFEWASFEWKGDHIATFTFSGGSDLPTDRYEVLRAKLDANLPALWDGDEHWRWEGVRVYFPRKSSMLSVIADTTLNGSEPNPHWKVQIETLWSVMRATVLGARAKLEKKDASRVREYLGGGHPLVDLPQIDFDADVDGAEEAVLAVFPGAVTARSSGLWVTVPLDHPFLRSAVLEWPNARGGKLKSITLHPRSNNRFGPAQDVMVGCVRDDFKVNGETNVSDYLKKDKDVSFKLPAGGHIRIYYHLVSISFRDYPWAGPMKPPTWKKLAATLDACGRR